MSKYANPAARLHTLLTQALAGGPDDPIRRVWCHALGIKEDDLLEFFYQYRHVYQLISDTEDAINRTERINKDPYLRPVHSVKRLLSSTNLDAAWRETRNQLVQTNTLGELEFVAEMLGETGGEEAISEQVLKSLAEQVHHLHEEVLSSNLEPSLKSILSDLLEKMRRALVDYRIRGAVALRDVAYECIGAVVVERAKFETALRTEPVVKKWWVTVVDFAKIVEVALKLKELAAHFTPWLLEPPK